MKRYWAAARAKVVRERSCRNCGDKGNLQAAHTIGRARQDRSLVEVITEMEADDLDVPQVFYNLHAEDPRARHVDPHSVIPLCLPCHQQYDAHQLDILPLLSIKEQLDAVRAAGGIEKARIRLTGWRM